MGLVIQFQRRAIESLNDEPEAVPPPANLDADQIYTADGKQLHIAGISEGIGTCSDIKKMDVLVLSELPPVRVRSHGELACAYTVLLRPLDEQEVQGDILAKQGVARMCVELLEPQEAQSEGIIFDRTDKSVPYTNIP
jgi:hypothetical protein